MDANRKAAAGEMAEKRAGIKAKFGSLPGESPGMPDWKRETGKSTRCFWPNRLDH
jgi:hypothetical protein